MHAAGNTMSRRYRYSPRMTAGELSRAMTTLGLSTGNLARLTGTTIVTVNKCLKGQDIPVHVQASLYVWQRDQEAYRLAVQWADEHAHDARDDEEPEPRRGDR